MIDSSVNWLLRCFDSVCRYGVGYHLTLVKKESCDQDAITNLVKGHVPTAEIISAVGAEIQFVLSSESSQNFEALFVELESKWRVSSLELLLELGMTITSAINSNGYFHCNDLWYKNGGGEGGSRFCVWIRFDQLYPSNAGLSCNLCSPRGCLFKHAATFL